MIDWSQVQEMRTEMGSDFDEVVALFLEEVGEVIARLEDSPEDTTLAADLHFLKGAALNLGFNDFAERCEHGETLAATRPDAVDLPGILSSYHASRDAFTNGLSRNAA